MKTVLLTTLGIMLAGALATAVHAETTPPDNFLLGRDKNLEPCQASRTWNDPRVSKYDRSYVITCRGTAGRSQGTLLIVNPAYTKTKLTNPCGKDEKVNVNGLGNVMARQCYDPAQGTDTVSASFRSGKYVYIGDALFSAVGPMEVALRTLSGKTEPVTDRYQANQASIDPKALPEAPTVANVKEVVDTSFDPNVVLANGILLNQQGSYVEASHILNDGLSRLGSTAPQFTRAQFELEAGIADSNVGQMEAADAHFKEARTLLIDGGSDKISAFLVRKLSTYQALDDINRLNWPAALDALQTGEMHGQPLMDPSTITSLNEPASNKSGSSNAIADRGELANKLLEAQRNWAASVAWLLGRGDYPRSVAALDSSIAYVNNLQKSVRADSLLAIKARIERQYGRLQARQGNVKAAIKSFDCALALLQGGQLSDDYKCTFDLAPTAHMLSNSGPNAFSGPVIAETQLERASFLADDQSVSRDDVVKAYSSAIDSLLASSDVGERQPVELEPYLDILVEKAKTDPGSNAAELYFRAVQAIGEPAVARQMAQLQNVVTANSTLAAKVRDRSELERQVVQLRYQISTASGLDAKALGDLDAARQKAENALLDVNAELRADPHFSTVDDQLVTVAGIRDVLNSGEWYIKVTTLKAKSYAIIVGRNRTYIHRINVDSGTLLKVAHHVRDTIRDDSGTVPYFDVPGAYAMFHLIAGPAETDLRLARALIVDPSGPLENLPASVLVASVDSVKKYKQTQATDPYDYSHVDFLAYRSDIYYALSPRALLISRSLEPSHAPKPFIGFGENAAPPTPIAAYADKNISFGGCDMPYNDFLSIMAANKPVSAREIGMAATALGVPGAPEVVRSDFTDTAVVANSNAGDYEQYQVIHFATHGLPESRLGCSRVPPSLITSVAPIDASGKIVSDGFLTFPEVAKLRFNANLVVLSACDTAAGVTGTLGRLSGEDESSATLDGLVRAFITARARAVMATYWNVPASVQTDQLIQTFYSSGRIYNMATALRTAQSVLIGQPAYSHPYYWGAYVLIGDGSKTMLTPPETKTQTAAAQ